MATFDRIAELPVQIEGYELDGLERDVSSDFTRLSTVIRMRGGGVEGVVGHVLPHALLAPAAHVDDGAEAGEVARDVALEPLELVAVDLNRKLGDAVEGGQAEDPTQAASGTTAAMRSARRCCQTVSSIAPSVTPKIIAAITLICGGSASRAAPQMNSG